MGRPGPLRSLSLILGGVLAVAACTPRQEPRPAAARPDPPLARTPAPAAPRTVAPAAPPAPVTVTELELADPERDSVLFTHWRSKHGAAVASFEEFLVRERVAQVVPTYQLLRSASMWKECRTDPFQLPPAQEWVRLRDLLLLVQELRQRQVLASFEVVSAYRDPQLNRCAGGAPRSAHVRFAVDLAPLAPGDADRLCRFWREHGQSWDMGVSRYPSGRIHIDRAGYRTWGASHRRDSSYCLQ
jgi:hypothetical protein